MNGSRPRASRRLSVGLACIAVVAACGGDADADDAGSPEPPSAAAAADGQSATADAEAVVEAVFEDYWNAVIQSQSGQIADPAELFDGIATDETIEYNLGVAQRYARQGLIRVGEPVISDVNVQVVHQTGVVSACVDESEWLAQVDGETLPPAEEQLSPHPIVFEVINSDGSWLIGDPIESGGTITC